MVVPLNEQLFLSLTNLSVWAKFPVWASEGTEINLSLFCCFIWSSIFIIHHYECYCEHGQIYLNERFSWQPWQWTGKVHLWSYCNENTTWSFKSHSQMLPLYTDQLSGFSKMVLECLTWMQENNCINHISHGTWVLYKYEKNASNAVFLKSSLRLD